MRYRPIVWKEGFGARFERSWPVCLGREFFAIGDSNRRAGSGSRRYRMCIQRYAGFHKPVDHGFWSPRSQDVEKLFVDCDEDFMGVVTEKLSNRKDRMTSLVNNGKGRARIEFSIPSRALIGLRNEFLTDTKGTGIMNTIFLGYEEYRGDFPTRFTGSIVSDRRGKSVAYGLFHLEPRGRLFVPPGVPVYEGMIVGEHNKDMDINVNPTKEKKLSNMRAAGKDENITCSPVQPMSLELAINFIRDDEMVEVTPQSIRVRKRSLSAQIRYTVGSGKNK
jgi:GTP-binding protein